MNNILRPCALIPVYRHGKTLRAVVASVRSFGLPVIVIDDGNDEETKSYISALRDEFPDVDIVTRSENGGKGAAVLDGFARAKELDFTHAFQIDADGQHDLGAVREFLDIAKENPDALVCGYPVYDESVPASRKNGRKVTNAWVAIETLSRGVTDAMCGFRLYPLEPVCTVMKRHRIGRRMTFDIEILVYLKWMNVPMVFLPLRVSYPEGGISNFRMVRDNIAISGMHCKLFFGMIPRLPLLLIRKVFRRER